MNKLIGITGVIGSGKSTVAAFVRDLGYTVLSSDAIAKNLIDSNRDLQNRIIDTFGTQSFENGKYNSKYISSIVFDPKVQEGKRLEELNNIIHPFVIDELASQSDELFAKGELMVFNESALIFEAGLDDAYDYIINVNAKKELIIKRMKKRTGLSQEEIENRMKTQLSSEEKKRLSDFTIENNGSSDELRSSTKFIIELLKDLPPKDYSKAEMD
jgi:dephospho-CoA kinase